MEKIYFNQYELANRWRITQRTLERWRWIGTGPKYSKLGNSVRYRIADILEYEQSSVKVPGAMAGAV